MQGQLSNHTLGNKYLLGELLGHGGFGEVYKAQNILLNRPQAIKVILEKHLSNPKFRERFLREAQTLAALNHPNIVHIDDFELEQERAYLVMPFISGGTLHTILAQRGRLSLEETTAYLRQICTALDYAHTRNVAHLDLKPHNFLHQNGILLLSDFGLSHLMKEGAVAGGTSLGFGSPLYMAPEQINGQPQQRSDIYALGVILYQMLTGRPPFEGPTPEGIIFKQVMEPPPPLSAMRPDVPRALGLVVEKALAKKPEERYATAGALLQDFYAALFPITIPPMRPNNGLNEGTRKSIQQMTTQSKEPDTISSPPPPVSLPSNTIKDVPRPKEIRDAIQGISDPIKARKPPKEKLPELTDQDLKAVLGDLAKGKPVSTLPDADAHYPPSPNGIRDPWRSGRGRWSIQSFRRRDKGWHFSGQGKDEVVKLVERKHWLFLIRLALPLLGFVIALFGVLALHARMPGLRPLWIGLEIVIGLLILGTAIRFLYKDFLLWWLETYIITDKRIISSRGLLEPTRQETAIEKVSQIGVDIPSSLGFLLDYGTVHVYVTGGDFFIRDVPHPKEIRDAIQGIYEEIKAKKPPKEKLPEPIDKDLKAVPGDLAKGKPVPTLPDADVHYPPRANGIRGPRRTFGGPLRIPCEVRYSSDEYTVMYIQRSRYVLYRNLALPFFLLLLMLPLTLFGPTFLLLGGLATVMLLITMFVIYVNYVDNVYILSTRRIIEIERTLVFFLEARTETEYKNIRDTRVKVSNIFQRLLDVGDVYIETAGNAPDIIFSNVDHPFVIQDKLNEIKAFKERVEKVQKENNS